jgi:phosphatidylglycerol---prolipoprotein diacylglyceryl transferase
VHFPVEFTVGRMRIHPHLLFEILAYLLAFGIYFSLRRRFGDPVSIPTRWSVVAFAIAGAAFGAKALYWLEDPKFTLQHLHDPVFLMGGKTIVGALIGGLVAVESFKRQIGQRESTGDLFAIPLATGIAIGRVGCFLTGLSDHTYGVPTWLPWGIDFGDGVHRHPTQLYEVLFLIAFVPVLYSVMIRIAPANLSVRLTAFRSGDVFKLFMVGYLGFRLLCDFVKPYPRVALGLGSIQWACVLVLIYYLPDVYRWFNSRFGSPPRNNFDGHSKGSPGMEAR